MAKRYEVRYAFQSTSLDVWICPDTADQVGKMSESELSHALKQGFVREAAPTLDDDSTETIRNNPADPTATAGRTRGGSK